MPELPLLTVADARKALADSGEVLYTKSYMQRCLAAALDEIDRNAWVHVIDGMPKKGDIIVCEFTSGGFWAGAYQGVKQSFLRWKHI